MAYLTTIVVVIVVITVSLAVPSFVIEKTVGQKGKLPRVRKILFSACIFCFVLIIIALIAGKAIEKNGQIVDTKTTSDYSIIETDGLVIEQKENNVTVIMSDGKEIGAYPTSVVKNMFDVDENGRIANQNTVKVNLTVRKTTTIRGFQVFGIWVVVEASDSWPVAVIFD